MVHGNLEINEPFEGFECPPDHGAEVVNAFSNEKIDLEGWRSVAARSRGYSETIYSNFFCPAQGSIFCVYNDKTKDHNDPKDRLDWSEIAFQIYQSEAARALQSPKLLRTVWRFWIVNPDTDTILGQAKSFGNTKVSHTRNIAQEMATMTAVSSHFSGVPMAAASFVC